MKKHEPNTLHLIIATVLSAAGLVLLFIALFTEPKGVIDSSVLVAYGEIMTFVGALFGIRYTYDYRLYKLIKSFKNDESEPKD